MAIIIIDDSASTRLKVRMVLEKAGYSVIECANGQEGFDKILELQSPDLVISDHNMPGLNGLTMLQKLKVELGGCRFPIFMMTTETNEKLKAAGREVGVLGWINKPFVPETLVAAVDKVLGLKKGKVA